MTLDALLDPTEAELQRTVRAFVDKEVLPQAAKWDEAGRYPRELLLRFGELGWLGTAFPESVGGSGGVG